LKIILLYCLPANTTPMQRSRLSRIDLLWSAFDHLMPSRRAQPPSCHPRLVSTVGHHPASHSANSCTSPTISVYISRYLYLYPQSTVYLCSELSFLWCLAASWPTAVYLGHNKLPALSGISQQRVGVSAIVGVLERTETEVCLPTCLQLAPVQKSAVQKSVVRPVLHWLGKWLPAWPAVPKSGLLFL